VAVEVRIQYEEEGNIIGRFAPVPCCHHVSRLLNFFRFIDVPRYPLLVDGVVPGGALLPTAHRVSTAGFEQCTCDCEAIGMGEVTFVVPNQAWEGKPGER
jgi:hypothetical protein